MGKVRGRGRHADGLQRARPALIRVHKAYSGHHRSRVEEGGEVVEEVGGGARRLRRGTGRWCRPNPPKPPPNNPPPMAPKTPGPRVSGRPQRRGDPVVRTGPAGGVCRGSTPVRGRHARPHDLGVGIPLPRCAARFAGMAKARAPGAGTLSVGACGPGADCRVSR